MSDITPDAVPETDEEYVESDICRDAGFVHVSADSAIVMDLGRDFEFSFLRSGSRPIAKRTVEVEEEEKIQVRFKSETIEVVRIRMSPVVALQAAMLSLEKLIVGDFIDTDAMMRHLSEIIASQTVAQEEE